MNNKVLVNVYFVKLDQSFDIYVPIYEKIGQIVELVSKTIINLSDSNFNYDQGYCIMDGITGQFYDINKAVKETQMRNGHKLLIF